MTPLNPEPVETFQQNYSGTTCYSDGVLTIESSGYLKMPNKSNPHAYFIWDVPGDVTEIIINPNTIVNAGFHYVHGLNITGLDRNTSVIHGTEIVDWNAIFDDGNENTDDCDWVYMSVWKKGGSQDSEIKNITFLNPKTYAIAAFQSDGKVDISNCNFIDRRAGEANNSDGIDAAINSTIENCYFETKDDNIKVTRPNSTVRDCTFRMIDNSVPFNMGWGSYSDGGSMTASNIKIIGYSGRAGDGNPIIQGGTWNSGDNGSSTVTININDIHINNPNASLVSILNGNQCLQGNINRANVQNLVGYWASSWQPTYNCSSLRICGASPGYTNSCNGTQWSGSSVDDYNIPSFAQNFINANTGNHAWGRYYEITNVNNTPSPACGGCQDDINITTTYNSGENIDHEAGNSITASNIINSGANVDYDAGYEITLVDGFHAKNGCDFHAFIDGCDGQFLVNGNDDSDTPMTDFGATSLMTNSFNKLDGEVSLRNFPNPFTGTTTIEYTLPQAREISLIITNMSGRIIRQIKQDELQEAGTHQLQFDAHDLPSGVYMCTLQAGRAVQIQKMTLIQ